EQREGDESCPDQQNDVARQPPQALAPHLAMTRRRSRNGKLGVHGVPPSTARRWLTSMYTPKKIKKEKMKSSKIDAAAPKLNLLNTQTCSHRKYATVWVEVPGPPNVSSTTGSNNFSASIERMMMAMTMAGLSRGSSMRQNVCQGEAPMTRAALTSWRGSAEKPDRKIRNVRDVHCHTSAMMIAHCAAMGCE